MLCYLDGMIEARELPPAVRDALSRLATSSDRTSPTVFAGRKSEFALLNDAVKGVQRGESGHTVVIQGVPGSGKTALLHEYAIRLLAANDKEERPVIPVPLKSGTMNAPPMAIVEEVDRQFRELGASNKWKRKMNHAVSGASLVGNALFTALTKKDINDFRSSSRAPNSLSIALEDYVAFRFDRRESTIVLLVDEAQNLHDTTHVRDYLEALHGGITGDIQVLLACFGLENTAARLRELGCLGLPTAMYDRSARCQTRRQNRLSPAPWRPCSSSSTTVVRSKEPVDQDGSARLSIRSSPKAAISRIT